MENDKSVRVGGDEEEEEEEEEVKMEKFFALIRSFREARNYYRRKEMDELEKKKRSNKKMKMMCGGEDDHLQKSSCWVPKFEQEDFTREVEFRRPPLVFPSPCNKEKAKKGEAEVALDLKLAL